MYKLYNGDCFKELSKVEDNSIDLILTDIPYVISKENNFKTMKDRKGRNGIDFGEWDKDFNINNLSILSSKLKDDGSLIMFHSFDQYSELKNIFESHDMIFKDLVVWKKTNPMPRNRDRRYVASCEMYSWYCKKNAKWVFNRQDEKYESNVICLPSESGGGFKRYHPCQKPIKLLDKIIKIHSNPNDIVLDCFMGSGSTGVSCIKNKRNFIGIELDKKYFDIAESRLKEASSSIFNV